MAILLSDSIHLHSWDSQLSADKNIQRERAALTKLTKDGGILRFPVADSYAVYKVVTWDPLTIAHVDYMDGHHVHAALIRGLTVEEARSLAEQYDAVRALQSGRTGKLPNRRKETEVRVPPPRIEVDRDNANGQINGPNGPYYWRIVENDAGHWFGWRCGNVVGNTTGPFDTHEHALLAATALGELHAGFAAQPV